MSGGVATLKAYGEALLKGLGGGQQSYFLKVPGAETAVGLSVVSFEAVEKLGAPYAVTVQLTHPLELERASYLGKPATFEIDPGDGTEPRKFAGCITQFSKTARTQDFHGYQMVVEPLVARLRLTRSTRVYQHQTAPQIIEAILRRHELVGHQFVFKLRREYPQHPFRLQYQMSDWDFIRLLMEQEGLYSYFLPGKFGEMVVFGDDIDHYLYKPELRVPYRESAGLEAGIEAVFGIRTNAKTVPESFLVADYNPDLAWEPLKGEANVARKDKTTYGQPYVFGTHHLDFDGAKWEAQLRHEAAMASQVEYEGESNVLELRPARILRMDLDLPDAPNGQVITEVTHTGARDAAYRNTFKSIPSDRRFRLPLDEANWPKIAGTLSARITSPSQYTYAYLTQQGYYTVRFDFDFEKWPGGGECVPLRLAKPFAGAFQTGFHFPLIDGTEAAIAFRDGNPNKPYIAHVHHNSRQTDLITNHDRWLSRNVIRTQSDNKLEFEDWEGQEHVKLSTEHSGKSQLTLGHMVDGKWKKRGEGFELRTSGWGAIRGGKGLFISADDQPGARGEQLAMSEAEDSLRQAMEMMRNLNESAEAAHAWLADADRQRELVEQTLMKLKSSAILAHAPKGVGIASGTDMQIAARRRIFVNAHDGVDVGVMKRLTLAAGEAISLFAARFGIRIFAAKGKVQVQAQDDALELMAMKNVLISASHGEVIMTAAKGITLGDGSGAFIKIANGRIEIASPVGEVNVKGNLRAQSPAGGSFTFPAWNSMPVQDVNGTMNFSFSK
ncbi:type VI secretion system secreted protein VgrG [Cupriavidus sp. OV038]|jgi:type VI secretion system secreted protein VgrG|uniref:type VI secretion system Vgr family protein n=1 Tax=unclassified Cupriavidus TaxID=2640874 RepID=UPI0008E45E1E|nr:MULTISPECIES: type VI secretion system Vgr family protein [unclassified Cupriavidus]SFC14443.1 type VI secretion system secreted protein VgrG [Cupriavidus sp. OV038]SFP09891.1 type VI secretion system secreted protein VgrG [Cupriavidus sp. OV096]